MAFAGGLGADVTLADVPRAGDVESDRALLYSESNTRFVCEVAADNAAAFEKALAAIPHAKIMVTS